MHNIDHDALETQESPQPEHSVFTTALPKVLNPYGHILGNVKEIVPDLSHPEFRFPEDMRACQTSFMPSILEPPPFTCTPPSGYYYPVSPAWSLCYDDHYRSHLCYSTSVRSDQAYLDEEKKHQLCLTTHPSVDPVFNDSHNEFIDRPFEGMVQMIAGIPYRLDIEAESFPSTFACYHTLASVENMYPEIHHELLPLTETLYLEVFGQPPSSPDGLDEIRPIFTLPFFRQNNRSENKGKPTRVEAGRSENYNGSYTLASTILQVAQGILVPAHQICYEEARGRVEKLLKIIQQLYLILGPISMSRFEWKTTQFHLEDNNIFSFGGLGQGGISIQFNVSSGFNGGNLVLEIGLIQGTWHVDGGDALTCRTLFILLLKLPPGMCRLPLQFVRIVIDKLCRST